MIHPHEITTDEPCELCDRAPSTLLVRGYLWAQTAAEQSPSAYQRLMVCEQCLPKIKEQIYIDADELPSWMELES